MEVANLLSHLRRIPQKAEILAMEIEILADPDSDLVLTFSLMDRDAEVEDDPGNDILDGPDDIHVGDAATDCSKQGTLRIVSSESNR